MLNEERRRIGRFVDSAESSYARAAANYPPRVRPAKSGNERVAPSSGNDDSAMRDTCVAAARALGLNKSEAEKLFSRAHVAGMSVQDTVKAMLDLRK